MAKLKILFLCFLLSMTISNAKNFRIESRKAIVLTQKDSIQIKNQEEKIAILEERLKQSSDTITNLNSMVTGFSAAFTIAGWFLALLAIGMPIITYYFGVKPSQTAIKDLETNMDKRITSYLEDKHHQNITTAIKNVNSDIGFEILNGLTYFQSNSEIILSEEQTLDLITAVEKTTMIEGYKGALLHFMYRQKSKSLDRYFKEKLLSIKENDSSFDIIIFLSYFLRPIFNNDIELFKEAIKNATEKTSLFQSLIDTARTNNKEVAIKLLNSKEINNDVFDSFANLEQKEYYYENMYINLKTSFAENDLKQVCFYQKYIMSKLKKR